MPQYMSFFPLAELVGDDADDVRDALEEEAAQDCITFTGLDFALCRVKVLVEILANWREAGLAEWREARRRHFDDGDGGPSGETMEGVERALVALRSVAEDSLVDLARPDGVTRLADEAEREDS